MLQQDDPAINEIVFRHRPLDEAVRRDIARGRPFGGATGPLPFSRRYDIALAPEPPSQVVDGLRRVKTKRQADRAASAADRTEALPGYARRALPVRIDCPAEVRAQFGSHPKFANRLREAGIVDSPREYIEEWKPAESVLSVLELGPRLFPGREAEALDVLGPLVRRELGGNVEAWAVLEQLLPTFTGTVPELVVTCGAIAHA
ncbi:hypothetical protein [Allokutzneria albata]|uniref:Uncharacterized protein n=1 Tax=Allokutzneria albata TaxID=211114 RepID=A0A1G9S682_ALLAB|nr:hypothetical protein [Allokutzneria albata]SDM30827.1 hypothetical protein SAMN04489726_0909 [Allokutzneria albata]